MLIVEGLSASCCGFHILKIPKYYSKEFQISTKTITEKTYDELHDKIVEHFGKYAGYGQQFLFKNEREIFDKKWLG